MGATCSILDNTPSVSSIDEYDEVMAGTVGLARPSIVRNVCLLSRQLELDGVGFKMKVR